MPLYPINNNPALLHHISRAGMSAPDIVLIDVGCSGGVADFWAPLSPILRAHGIDPLVNEIERLKQAEARAGVTYHAATIVGPQPARGPADFWFDRSSAWQARQVLARDYVAEVYCSGDSPTIAARELSLDDFCAEQTSRAWIS